MKELEITCLCRSLKLPDLGLDLVKGQVEHVGVAEGRNSPDLTRARQNRGVSVREVQRARERRIEMSIPPRRSLKPTKRGGAQVPPSPLVVQGEVDMGEFRELIRTEVTGAVKDAILAGGLPSSYSVGVASGEAVKAPMRNLVSDRGPLEPDTPMFIPSGIVKKGVSADISAETTESSGGGVDAATKALKGRKSAKKKPRKKKKG